MSTYAAARMRREIQATGDALNFTSAMLDAAGWSAPDVLDFMEKPHKWSDEFALWIEHGKPTAGAEGFAAFVALIEAAS